MEKMKLRKKITLGLIGFTASTTLLTGCANSKSNIADDQSNQQKEETENSNKKENDKGLNNSKPEEKNEEELNENEKTDLVANKTGIVKEVLGNGDIVIHDVNDKSIITHLKPLNQAVRKPDNVKVGDVLIAFTLAHTPQTMELPESFRYGALVKHDEDVLYRADIFDENGLSKDGMFQITFKADEFKEFNGKPIVIKYKNSTRSIPEQVNLEDVDIIEISQP